MPEPDRDIEPVLKHVLRTSSGAAVSVCPDAETLAAWHERTLPAVEMTAFERHAADCAHCRAMLAAFVRADLAAPVAEPGSAALDAVPFWRRWRLNWLVPIAATATALAVYVATPVPSDDRSVTRESVAEESLAERASDVARSNEVAAPLEKARESFSRDSLAPDTAEMAAPAAPADEAARNVETRGDARDRRAQAEADTAASPSFAPVPVAPATPTPAAPRAASPPPPSAGAAAAEAVSPSAPQGGAASLVDAPSAERVPGALRRERSADLNEQASGAGLRSAARLVPLSGSSSGLRFRISGDRLERSASGETWVAVTLPAGVSGADITSGMMAGRTIWMVGRGGLVLRSLEDEVFVRVPSPSSADFRTVTAEDERTATVIASDGRRYSTTDGGGRWTAR